MKSEFEPEYHAVAVSRCELVLEVDAYFSQRSDAAGVTGEYTDQKIMAAMRQLAFRCPSDAAAELLRIR